MKNKKLSYIIITSIITIILLYVTDQVLQLSYISKVFVKLVVFTLFPFGYIRMTRDNFLKDSLMSKRRKLRSNKSHVLGIVIFVTIIVVYHFIKQYIDIETLVLEFEQKYRINKDNILYYSIYLTFVNSLLEEFFFRGFIFLNLKKIGMKSVGYIVSSLAFAIYHVSNFQNWFNIGVFVLAIIGLFVGGMIFNYLDDEENTFLNSWFVHICADLAIVLIGFSIFKVI